MNSGEKSVGRETGRGQDAETATPHDRELTSEAIFAGAKTITITHDGVRYRLQITRNNKLILQK